MQPMYRTLQITLLAATLIAGCKREEVRPPTVTRTARMTGPTSQQISEEKKKQLLADLDPIPSLGEGTVSKSPDGEVWTRFSNGLMIHDVLRADGLSPRLGQTVSVAYKGMFPSLDPAQVKVFDQRAADNPLTFQLGSKSMIRGFSLGISTMKIGSKRRIFVPPDLAYGPGGKPEGGIPPNQPLIFEVELLAVSGDALDSLVPVVPKVESAGPPAPETAPATGK